MHNCISSKSHILHATYMVDGSSDSSLTSTPTTDELTICPFRRSLIESTKASPYIVNITGLISYNSNSISDNWWKSDDKWNKWWLTKILQNLPTLHIPFVAGFDFDSHCKYYTCIQCTHNTMHLYSLIVFLWSTTFLVGLMVFRVSYLSLLLFSTTILPRALVSMLCINCRDQQECSYHNQQQVALNSAHTDKGCSAKKLFHCYFIQAGHH